MPHDEKLKNKLVGYLQDAYAMENQIAEALEKQVKATVAHPDIQARIQEHLEATRQHRARMEQRITALGQHPSAVKGLMTTLMGNMQGALGGTRSDALAMNARDDFVIENLEICSYAMLIATAQLYGDQETVRACELNLHDELVMREWLQEHIVQATYLALQEDGISIPQEAWREAQQTVASALRGGGIPGMSPGAVGQQTSSTGMPA